MKKYSNIKFSTILLTGLFFIGSVLPLFAQNDPDDLDEDPGVPISDYWWVLALIGIYFIYKKYQVLHKQA